MENAGVGGGAVRAVCIGLKKDVSMARKLFKLGLSRNRGYVYMIGPQETIVVEKRPVRSVRPTPVLPHLEPATTIILDTGLKKRKGEFYFIDKDGDLSADVHPRFARRTPPPAVERRDPTAPLPPEVTSKAQGIAAPAS